MRIGIISDTHMPARGRKLPDALAQGLQGVDLILHAGDWTDPRVADELEKIAPVDGIAGNNDGAEIRIRFGTLKLLHLKGKKIGMIHGDGFRMSAERRAREAFRNVNPDLIIFGHSHVPYKEVLDGVLMFNPGSPTDKRRQPRYSYGILELNDVGLSVRHHFYTDKS